MIRAVSFMPVARLEFLEAYYWYEARGVGLGAAFQSEVDRQIARIVERPLLFSVMLADVRRARLRRFPYGLFFRVVDDEAFIIACFHSSRDPKAWQRRV